MKKRFTGVLIGLALLLILSGNFNRLSFAQTPKEQCDEYKVCAKSNGMLITNLFFGLEIQYEDDTGRLRVVFDENRGGFEIREGKKRVGFRDEICGVQLIAENFKKVPGQLGEYTVNDDKKPTEFDFSSFRGDKCRHCTQALPDLGITFSPLNP